MRRRGPGNGVQVELIEDDDLVEGGGGTSASQRDDRARSRLLRLAGVGVLVALVVVVVVADVVERRRDAALWLELRGVAGFMDPFDGPITEVWRAPGEWPVFETEQVMVLQSDDGSRMTAVDPASGTVLWSRDVPPGMSCQPFGDDAVPATLWDRIACAQARGERDSESFGSLLVLDAAEGTVLLSRTLEVPALFVHPIDGDLIIASEGPESRLELRRSELQGDRELWSYSSEPGLRTELVSDVDGFWGWWVEDGVLVIQSMSVTLALDVATGEEVNPPTRAGARSFTRELSDGGRIEMTHPTAIRGDVLNADGSLRYQLNGQLWMPGVTMPGVTDGSAPGILAIRDSLTSEVIGLDAATGEPVWNAGRLLAEVAPTVLVDGVAVAQGGRTAVGIDMASGSTLWSIDVASSVWWPPLTDGRVVLFCTRSDGAEYIAAHDVRTGGVVWRVPAPEGIRYAQALGRSTVLVYSGTEIVAYR